MTMFAVHQTRERGQHADPDGSYGLHVSQLRHLKLALFSP